MKSTRALWTIILIAVVAPRNVHHFGIPGNGTMSSTRETHHPVAKAFDGGEDLEFFLSRPNLRPPRFDISHIDVDKVEPGYWFVAPYVDLHKVRKSRQLQLCQEGPHIYDQAGQLIWSGACEFSNLNVHDFKVTVDGRISMITGEIEIDSLLRRGSGMILDNSYMIQDVVYPPPTAHPMDMHEFTYLGDDRALYLKTDKRLMDARGIGSYFQSIWVVDGGFEERNIKTGEVYFSWMATEHANLTEGATLWKYNKALSEKKAWDWLHLNAVDKDPDGNYLLSARHTDTIYKISKDDGSIIWRLGGKYSSFEQIGFNFSRQHDVRFRSQNGSKTTISFLNNGADDHNKTATTSAAYFVELDTYSMTAKLLRSLARPDRRLTILRGNAQALPLGNTLVSWSENGYMSEFDPEGNVVLEAKFASKRLVNYRTYKFPFLGISHEPIALKCYSHNDLQITGNCISATICYVSWNGATEVRVWYWYGTTSDGRNELLGSTEKTGFETSFALKQSMISVYVEAIDLNGQVIGTSEHHSNAQVLRTASNCTQILAKLPPSSHITTLQTISKLAEMEPLMAEGIPRPVLAVFCSAAGFFLGALCLKLLQWQCRDGCKFPSLANKSSKFSSSDYVPLMEAESRRDPVETPMEPVKIEL